MEQVRDKGGDAAEDAGAGRLRVEDARVGRLPAAEPLRLVGVDRLVASQAAGEREAGVQQHGAEEHPEAAEDREQPVVAEAVAQRAETAAGACLRRPRLGRGWRRIAGRRRGIAGRRIAGRRLVGRRVDGGGLLAGLAHGPQYMDAFVSDPRDSQRCRGLVASRGRPDPLRWRPAGFGDTRPQETSTAAPRKGLGDRFGERVGQGVGTGQAVRPARCTGRFPAGPPGHHLGPGAAQRRPGRAVPVGARAGVPAELPAFGFDDDADGAQQPLADLRTARDAPACAAVGHVLGEAAGTGDAGTAAEQPRSREHAVGPAALRPAAQERQVHRGRQDAAQHAELAPHPPLLARREVHPAAPAPGPDDGVDAARRTRRLPGSTGATRSCASRRRWTRRRRCTAA